MIDSSKMYLIFRDSELKNMQNNIPPDTKKYLQITVMLFIMQIS